MFLFYQKQCKKVLRVHKTLLFTRNSCFHLLNLLQGRIRSVLFTLFKSLYLLVHYYIYQSTNIIHLWGLLGLTTTFLTIGSETFGFSSEMFAPQKVVDSYPKMLLIPILAAKFLGGISTYLKSATYVTIFLVIMVMEVRSTKCVRLYNPTHFLTEYERRMWIHPLNKTLSLLSFCHRMHVVLEVTIRVRVQKTKQRCYTPLQKIMIRRHKVLMLTI